MRVEYLMKGADVRYPFRVGLAHSRTCLAHYAFENRQTLLDGLGRLPTWNAELREQRGLSLACSLAHPGPALEVPSVEV